MYPYVSAATAAAHHHHQQQAAAAAAFGAATGSMVPGAFSSSSTAALAAAVDAATDKSCRLVEHLHLHIEICPKNIQSCTATLVILGTFWILSIK